MVADIDKTIEFYTHVLGFELVNHQPEEKPFVWAMMRNGAVMIMFQESQNIRKEYPILEKREPGGGLTLFVRMVGITELYEQVIDLSEAYTPLKTTFYGMKEFSVLDPDGNVITFAEPTELADQLPPSNLA